MDPHRITSNPDNLRRDVRVEGEFPVVMQRGKMSMPLVTSDVSFRGLFVPTTIAPALRSLVRIRMTLGVRIIDTHAMVIHIRTDPDERVVGIGLQFWGLTGTERIGWDAFVNGLLTTKRATAKRIAEASAADAAEGSTPSGVRAVTSPDSSR